jgi:hypothetical protein
MFRESPHNFETNFNLFDSKEEATRFILERISGYSESKMDTPVGDEQTTLNQFLARVNDGSEWTDPHGFKINVIDGKFKVTINQ